MAVIRDVMPAFELFQPASVADALALLDRHGRDAWVLAGGLDSFDWLKERVKRPSYVIDLSGVAELKGIRGFGDGLEIGAMTTLTEVVRHAVVRERYGILLEGAESAARGIEIPPTGRGVVVRRVDEMTAWSDGDDPVECL